MKILDKIRCILDHPINRIHAELLMQGYEFPKKGEDYTIRRLNSEGGILLCEIINPLLKHDKIGFIEVAFHPCYFRQIIEKDDLSKCTSEDILEEMEINQM